MPLGNLKAIGRLHLSGRARRDAGGTPPNCRKGGDGGGETGWGTSEKKREKSAAGTTHFHRTNGAAPAVFASPREELSIFTP